MRKYSQEDQAVAFEIANMCEPDCAWRDDAPCSEALQFAFPEDPDPAERRKISAQFIAAYCGNCSVTKECLYTGLTMDCEYGIWGGYAQLQFRRIGEAYRDIIMKTTPHPQEQDAA